MNIAEIIIITVSILIILLMPIFAMIYKWFIDKYSEPPEQIDEPYDEDILQ